MLELNRAEQALEVARGAWPAAKPDLKSANQAEIRICFLIARCCLQLQRGEEAQRYLTSVCHPRQPDETLRGWAHLLLGTIESGKQNPAKALVHYEQAKRALGHNLFVDACFAELECQRKRWHAAIPYLQRVKGKLAAAGPAERQWVTHRGLDGPKLDWWLLQASLETDQLQSALEAVAALRNTTWAVPAEIAICLYLWDHRQQSEALRPVVEFRRSRPEDPALFDLEFRFRLTLRPIDELDGIFLASPPALQADDSWYRLYSTWNLIKATSPEQVRNQAAQFSPRLAEQPTGRLARTLELVAAATKRSAEKVGDKKVSDEKSSEKKNNEKKNVAKKSSDPRLAVQVTRQTEQQTSDPDLRRQSAFALASLEFAKTVFALQIDQQDYCSLALRLTESAFREQPTEALLRQQISKQLPALFTNKMHQATVEELDCFLKQYPLDPFLVGLHAEVLLAAGESKLALETLDGLVNLLPDSTIPRIRKAQILFQMDQLEEALCELEPVLARSPDHHGARLLAAKVAFKLRRFPAARDWAAETLKDEPSAWPLYLIVAECYRQEKRLSEALAIVEELIEKRPQYLDAHRMRVLLTHDSQGPVTALQLCHQVQTIFPGENKLKHDLQQLSKLVEKSPSSM